MEALLASIARAQLTVIEQHVDCYLRAMQSAWDRQRANVSGYRRQRRKHGRNWEGRYTAADEEPRLGYSPMEWL